jgi:AcrR family transcriptional regulator
MDTKLVDASLLPELAPRPFKFTSKQGRTRRATLLASALELLREKAPEEITLAMVCERAEIPRPSAYHFFPNIEAIFLGIRMLHGEMLIEQATDLESERFKNWQAYIERFIDVAVDVTKSETAFPRLVYGYGAMLSGARELGQDIDTRMARVSLDGLHQHFGIEPFDREEEIASIGLAIGDSVLRFSYRKHADLIEPLVQEAKRAVVAYLGTYLKA